jgi:radical SAM superfamily enzyme YgiQ (UPF0313 family)
MAIRDTVRRSILLDSKADMVVFGMGERTVLDIARGLSALADQATDGLATSG